MPPDVTKVAITTSRYVQICMRDDSIASQVSNSHTSAGQHAAPRNTAAVVGSTKTPTVRTIRGTGVRTNTGGQTCHDSLTGTTGTFLRQIGA